MSDKEYSSIVQTIKDTFGKDELEKKDFLLQKQEQVLTSQKKLVEALLKENIHNNNYHIPAESRILIPKYDVPLINFETDVPDEYTTIISRKSVTYDQVDIILDPRHRVCLIDAIRIEPSSAWKYYGFRLPANSREVPFILVNKEDVVITNKEAITDTDSITDTDTDTSSIIDTSKIKQILTGMMKEKQRAYDTNMKKRGIDPLLHAADPRRNL